MEVRKTVLVPHSAEDMFDLIEAAEHYPAFVPGCRSALILERDDTVVAARLTLRSAGISIELQTRNPKRRPTWMEVTLTRGPFRHFNGQWRLTPLNASACRIDFTLAYELDGLSGRVAAPVFARIADTLVDAFVSRAERVLGVGRLAAVGERIDERIGERIEARAAAHSALGAPAAAARIIAVTPAQPTPPPIGAAMTDPSLLPTLRASRLAAELTDEESRLLAEAMQLRQLTTGEVLVREGQADEHFYLIVKGVLGVVKGAGTAEPVTLNTLSAGDFAGELSWLDGAKRYASLVAIGDTEVLGLERARLEALLPKEPWLVYRVMRAIIRAVHQIQYRLSMQQSELSNYIYKQHGKY
ncbi:MAG TPA: SRPBCC family protein [Steroidobacteraceae bacterium]|nr:SRPBCC family protein [Steroidobacteraceae bacterium]